ncbi:MAG: MotA/TolQ/ExbB proton channel family protein [Verrucomicrobia bacterium]|nr:MotA/TolQ/ExbB proton channel family protein [Verrucomicrobiota bacterium]
MNAIATLAALLCSAALTFAQDGHSSLTNFASPMGLASISANSAAPSPLAAAGAAAALTPLAAVAAVTPLDGVAAGESSSEDYSVNNLWELLRKGGWAMIPLGLLSVLTGMLVVGYSLTIRRGTVATRQYISAVEVLIRKKDYLGVLAVSNRHGEALARVVQRALDFATKNPGVPFESLKEVAEAEGSAQASAMQHRVAYLADIGILAPMVGLFGTVIGIIHSFAAIGNGGASISRDILLASGVSEALIATAAGLVLAVISAGFYAIFRNRVQGLISELEGASSHVMGLLAASYQRRREPSRSEDEF